MVLPLIAIFAVGVFFDTSPVEEGQTVNGPVYCALVVARVIAVLAIVGFFWKSIAKTFPVEIDHWGWLAGVIGVVLWVVVCGWNVERYVLDGLGFSTEWMEVRDAVNPFETYSGPALIGFLLARFMLLALCIPVAEELFLRGFVMRAVETENWHELPLSGIGRLGWGAAVAYAVLTHPGEMVAAALWFSMITVVMVRTGKFWNCVLAHAVTNLLLGIYVCYSGAWHLW